MSPRPIPKLIGRYEVVESLGRGGMAVVYRGRDPRIDRPVAIKVLRLEDDVVRDRFVKEARSAGNLTHPNIVTIFDYGEHDDQPFIVMELVDGPTLAELLEARTPLTLTQKVEIVDAICCGLDYAHARGIVHRDIKPANVLIGRQGAVKIADFGIARLAESTLTQSGALMGTPNYMSPEQIDGRPVDRRSDIFAVGLVFYEVLTGQRAFQGDTPHVIMHAIVSGAPVPLRTAAADIDPDLEAIVERAIQPAPEDRYQSLAEMREQIGEVRLRLERDRTVSGGLTTIVFPTRRLPAAQYTPPAVDPDLERVARRRQQQIRTFIDDARRAIDIGNFGAAIDACEHLLLIHPEDSTGLDLLRQARAAQHERGAGQPASPDSPANEDVWPAAEQDESAAREAREGFDLDPASLPAGEPEPLAPDAREAEGTARRRTGRFGVLTAALLAVVVLAGVAAWLLIPDRAVEPPVAGPAVLSARVTGQLPVTVPNPRPPAGSFPTTGVGENGGASSQPSSPAAPIVAVPTAPNPPPVAVSPVSTAPVTPSTGGTPATTAPQPTSPGTSTASAGTVPPAPTAAAPTEAAPKVVAGTPGATAPSPSAAPGGAARAESASASMLDREGIDAAVEQYRRAYNQQDLHTIQQVYPRATGALTFGNALKLCSAVDLSFLAKQVDLLSDGRAQVETRSVYGCTPKTRQARIASPEVIDTFKLEKRGSSWIIVELLVPRGK